MLDYFGFSNKYRRILNVLRWSQQYLPFGDSLSQMDDSDVNP